MNKDEALKLALEALNEAADHIGCPDDDDAIGIARRAIQEVLAQPEFTEHEVENTEGWSEWVCPDPKSYLMKCCDCGLVHEAQFKVVRYKSDAEHEDCDPVEDPNVQAVFRMRRSEQWSPEDRAYRPGGLAQPEQEPVACIGTNGELVWLNKPNVIYSKPVPLYTTPPNREWQGLTDEQIEELCWTEMDRRLLSFARAIEAKLKEKNG